MVVLLGAEAWRRRSDPRRGAILAAVTAPIVGLGVVLFNSAIVDGSATTPLRIQEPLRGDFVEPVTRVLRAVKDAVGHQALADGLHAPFAIGFIVLLVLGARRLPVSWTMYAGCGVIVAVAAVLRVRMAFIRGV